MFELINRQQESVDQAADLARDVGPDFDVVPLTHCADVNHAARYSSQDTLHAQGSACVDTATRLLSCDGWIMLAVTPNTGGRHDTSTGAYSCESNTLRFGHGAEHLHACRGNSFAEVSRHSMSKRNIGPNVNFFINVPIEPSGALATAGGVSAPDDYAELTAAMDVLCVIANCQKSLNPCHGFHPTSERGADLGQKGLIHV